MVFGRTITVFAIISILLLLVLIPMVSPSSVKETENVNANIQTVPEFEPRTITDMDENIYLRNRIFDPLSENGNMLFNIDRNLIYSSPTGYALLQFYGPVLDEWKREVEKNGAQFIFYIPDYAFIVKLEPEARDEVAALDCVRWVGDYHPYYKLSPDLLEAFRLSEPERDARLGASARYYVSLFDTSTEGIAAFKKTVSGFGGKFHTIDLDEALKHGLAELELTPDMLVKVSRMEEVSGIQPVPEIVLHNYNDARIVDARQEQDGPFKNDGLAMWSYDPATDKFYGWTGSNASIAVVDTGIDGTHPAFDGRKATFFAYNWAGQWQDVQYHGTHVAGTALGNGRWRPGDPSPGTTGRYAGIAPNASLIGQAYLGSGYSLSTVMRDAARAGADVSTNSWGYSYWYGVYDNGAAAYDGFVRDSTDGIPMTVTFSAGNDGSGATTITPPATAKNILCVGSTDDNNGNSVSGFSSRGPLEDGRLKPDIVVPGAQVTSSLANSAYSYAAFSGTSMAAPGVAGGAAVVTDYYQVVHNHDPSPALVKAVLLNGAEPLPGYTWPDNNQGWGRMNLPNSLLETEHRKFLFYDQTDLLRTNEEVTYEFNVAEETPMKIHLVWTDVPGNPNAAKALVNDLDLIVNAPTGETYLGNQFYLGQSIPGGSADNTNNVEAVSLSNPPLGKWTLTVRGANVADGRQDFAVIISGPVWEDMLDISTYEFDSEPGPDVFSGEQIQFNCSFKNTGTLKFGGSQYVLTDYRPDGSSRKLLVSNVGETLPGGFFNFTLKWQAEMVGQHRLVLSVDPLNAFSEANETNNIIETYITVNSFGVRLDCKQQELGITPGEPSTLTVGVYNTGTVKDTYNLVLENLPPGWTAAFNTSNITVGAGRYQNVTLQILIPKTEKAGFADGLTVVTSSMRAPEFKSQQCFSVKIGSLYGFEVIDSVQSKEIEPGGSTSYEINVRNTGNTALLLKLVPPGAPTSAARRMRALSEGWSIGISTDKILIPYNASSNFTVTLNCPENNIAGHTESVELLLELDISGSENGINGEKPVVKFTLNATVLQYYDFEIELKSTNMEVEANKVRRIEFSVINNGNGWDTFEFDAIVPSGWGYTFNPETISINAFEKEVIRLNLKIPAGSAAGQYDVAIKTVSHCDVAKICGLRLKLQLLQEYNARIVIENQVVIVPVDSSLILPLYIINDGNGNDTVNLEVNWFDDFIIFSNTSVLVPMGETKKVNALIHIPDYFSPSNHTVEISAVSEDGESVFTQEIKVLVTPAQITKKPVQPQPDVNTTEQDSAKEAAGLFDRGWYFDIFIIILLIFIVIILSAAALFAMDKSFDSKAARKDSEVVRRTIATSAAKGAAGRSGVMHEVTLVRKKREYSVVRRQKRLRGVRRKMLPAAVEAEEIKTMPDTDDIIIEGETVEELNSEDGLVVDAELVDSEAVTTQSRKHGSGNNRPPYSSFISILVILMMVISGFSIFSMIDSGLESATAENFQGNIYNDTVWSENMTLTGHTTVRPGVTLYILPGVHVYFDNGVRLNVAGTLYANGTSNSTIVFTSVREKPGNNANPWKGIWNRIQFNGSSAGGLNYCEVRWATYGVIFDATDGNRVSNIHIENSTFYKNRNGIYLYDYADYNVIKNNTIVENGWGYGIYIRASNYNYFEYNNMTDNTYSFIVTGWAKEHFIQYFNGSTNTAQGRPMYYYVNRQDETVPEDAIFAAAVGCTNVTIRNITAEKGGEGILLAYSDRCTVDSVTVKNNNYGIYLYQAGEANLLTNVRATSNSYGVYMHNSYNNILRDCRLGGNTYSIYLVGYNPQRFDHDIDTSNKVDNNKPIYYYVNEINKTVPSNAGFVGLVGCTNITVEGIDSRYNAQGILVAYSADIHIENVYLYKNFFGTYYYRNTGAVTLSNSSIVSNQRGSWFFESGDATFRDTLYDINYDGFEVSRSTNIRVINCSIVAANRWNINMYGGGGLHSTVILLNTSFNPNKIRVVDTGTMLTVKWFLNIKAKNDLGAPASCRVIVRDGMDSIVTDRNIAGNLDFVECVGYQQTPSEIKFQFNNYTVEARNSTLGIIREINMTYSRDVEFVFNSKPVGLLPEFLEMEEDGELVIDLNDYFSDANELTYTTYIYKELAVAIDNVMDTATITATPDFCGQELIIIRVIDEHGEYIESAARVNVTPVNDAPEFVKAVPHIHLPEGKRSYYFDLTDYIDDPDKKFCVDTTRWYIEGEDTSNVTILGENSTSMLMGITIDNPDYNGRHKLTLVLEDSQGAKAEQELWLNLTERNDAPFLTDGTFSPAQGDTGTEFEFMVSYTDIEGDLPNSVQLILDGVHYNMKELNASDKNTADGKIFYYRDAIPLVGTHSYAFAASDIYDACVFTPAGTGPYVAAITPTTGEIEGKVVDARFGLSLSGATVSMYYANNGTEVENGTINTDAHGFFEYRMLSPGFYYLEIESVTYVPHTSDSFLVKPGEVVTEGLTFSLEPIFEAPAAVRSDTEITDVAFEIIYAGAEPMAETIIEFSATASDADGDKLIYYWYFEDGSRKPTGAQVIHNFTLPGMYNITLTVLDADGNIATAEKTIVLKAQPVPAVPDVSKEGDNSWGNLGWLVASIALLGILLALLPLFLFYRKRRKRAKTAAKKLKALKKQMEMKAAVARQQIPPAYAQTIEAEAIDAAGAVPQVTVPDRPALPPADVPDDEGAEITGEMGAEVVPVPVQTSVAEQPAVEEPVIEPQPAPGLFSFKKPEDYTGRETGPGTEAGEYECPECGAGIAESDIKCPGCGIEFED